jgi:hypothetical protein
MSCFLFYLLFFCLQNLRIGGQNRFCTGGWGVVRIGVVRVLAPVSGGDGERGKRMNMVQIMCTNVCKCKNDTY